MIPFTQYRQAADYILSRIGGPMPPVAVTLGSGLGTLADQLQGRADIPYADISGFPVPSVASHAGVLCVGTLGGRPVALLSGRSHYYEGRSFEEIAFPVRVLYLCGVKQIILTNAAGGVDTGLCPGSLMLIRDHIKFTPDSPCRGWVPPEFGIPFPDMSCVYTPALREIAAGVLREMGLPVREGVYFYMTGPQFETPAEIRAIRALGGSAVGMSTVPEAIAAAACGMQVLGISCISNMAAGVLEGHPITDAEVLETADRVGEAFRALIRGVLAKL